MPRSNRSMIPGYPHHLTARCHGRKFMLDTPRIRDEYCARLGECARRHGVPLLDYNVTSNHTHLLPDDAPPDAVSRFMHDLQGGFAAWFNTVEERSGALWGDRFHCTTVDGTEYLARCVRYMDMNMVRAGVVRHPADWEWCGYREIVGQGNGRGLIQLDRLSERLGFASVRELAEAHEAAIAELVERGDFLRQPHWTESVAVGSEAFVRSLASASGKPRRWCCNRASDESWQLVSGLSLKSLTRRTAA